MNDNKETNPGQQLAIEPAPESTTGQSLPLIKLVALPVIEEQLRTLKPGIEKRVADAMKLVCTEENLAEIKALRATMNKEAEALHKQKMAIINEVTKPIDAFNDVYKDCVSGPYQAADNALKQKITDVEKGMKDACEAGLRKLFGDLTTAHHLAWLQYERAGIKVSLTDAKSKTQPPKKLRDALTQFVERVAQDVEMICGLPDANEIMVEYRQTLNAPVAIQTVNLRHQRIAEAEAEKVRRAEARKQEQEAAARVAEAARQFEAPQPVQFAPPAAVQEPEPPVQEIPVQEVPEVYTVKFAVSGTMDQLRDLKRFMENGGYTYTDIS